MSPPLLLALSLQYTLFTICLSNKLDILLKNGHVIDPHSNTDTILHVGITTDRISFINKHLPSNNLIDNNTKIIDINGLILSPGFIDIHAHHQNVEGNEYQARDGVTTSLELEIGSFPVKQWYNKRINKHNNLLNFGVSTGHVPLRLYISNRDFYTNLQDNDADIDDILIEPFVRGIDKLPLNGEWSDKEYNANEMKTMLNYIEMGLQTHGSLGIGLGIAYVGGGCNRKEIYEIYKLAQKYDTIIFVHVRQTKSIAAMQEVIANCAVFNVSTHIMHVTSSSMHYLPVVLDMVENGASNNIPITTEVYPYAAGSTLIDSAVFDEGWQEKNDATFKDIQYVKTGERLNEKTFKHYRENVGGLVILHNMKEANVETAIKYKDIIISSDGLPFIEKKYGHPRASGTFSKVLSTYVRQKGIINLMDAIKKISYLPSKLLATISDEFKYRGKIEIGCYADITIFDKDKVIDMGTYTRGAMPSEGIMYVFVNGVMIVENQRIVPNVYPGRPLRSNLYDTSRVTTDKNEL
eukprot:93576_1